MDGLASNLAKVVEQLGKFHAGSVPPGSGAKPPARAAAAAAGAEPGPPTDETYKEAQGKVDTPLIESGSLLSGLYFSGSAPIPASCGPRDPEGFHKDPKREPQGP